MSKRHFGSVRRFPSGRYQAAYWHDGRADLRPVTRAKYQHMLDLPAITRETPDCDRFSVLMSTQRGVLSQRPGYPQRDSNPCFRRERAAS